MHVPADLADTNLDVVAYIPRLITQTFRGAERRVLAQFKKIRDGEFDDRTFAALKQGLLAAETLKWEHNKDRALAMAHAFVARGGWDGHLRYLQQLKAPSPAPTSSASPIRVFRRAPPHPPLARRLPQEDPPRQAPLPVRHAQRRPLPIFQ
jgi:hypothetical protein